jgi:2',3'-cyclic-nucleotide 2'-phosphodiesterase (5'-nucleotidase family)
VGLAGLAGGGEGGGEAEAGSGTGSQSLVLVLTAATHGEMLACRPCRLSVGGLARRAGFIQACRDTADYVLVADGGDLLPPGGPDPQVDGFLLGLLARLGYSALGVGEADLAGGPRYLKELAAAAPGLEWTSANVVDARSGAPLFAPWVRREVGGHTIGFTSCLDPALWAKRPGRPDSIAVLPALPAMTELVATMRRECDLVVCFVHMETGALRRLLTGVDGIDIAVASHDERIEYYPQRIGSTYQVMYAGHGGKCVNWSYVFLTPEGAAPYRGRTYYLTEGGAEDSALTREIVRFLGTDDPAPAAGELEEEEKEGEAPPAAEGAPEVPDGEGEEEEAAGAAGSPR